MATKKRKTRTKSQNRSYPKTSSKARSSAQPKKALTVFIAILFVLMFASLASIAYAFYYFNNDPPTSVIVGKVDALAYDKEENYPIEIQLYTNTKGNGKYAYEYKTNYYTDTEIPEQTTLTNADKIIAECFKTVYSQGVQFIDEAVFTYNKKTTGLGIHSAGFGFRIDRYLIPKNAFFYNTSNGVSFEATNNLDYLDNWIIDFGANSLGMITQDKGFTFDHSFLWNHYYYHIDIYNLIFDIYSTVDSLDYGKQVIAFDLSDYLTFEFFDVNDLKFHTPQSDQQHLYVNVLVNKSENGLVDASQSLFKSVQGDSNWNYTGIQSTEYWTSHTVISLTEADFVLDNNNLLSLNPKALAYYKLFYDLDIEVNINVENTSGVGFARNAFDTLAINRIIIVSSYTTIWKHYNDLPCAIITDSNVTLEVIV